MSYYMKRKEELREEAIYFQDIFLKIPADLQKYWTDYFTKYGKRFGLLTEFKENGIL